MIVFFHKCCFDRIRYKNQFYIIIVGLIYWPGSRLIPCLLAGHSAMLFYGAKTPKSGKLSSYQILMLFLLPVCKTDYVQSDIAKLVRLLTDGRLTLRFRTFRRA
jgi:hypothetical protein